MAEFKLSAAEALVASLRPVPVTTLGRSERT